MFDQDEAAISEGQEVEETEREQERRKSGPLGEGTSRPLGEGTAGPLGEGTSGAGGAAEGERRVLEGLRMLRRQECIGAFSVHSDAGWRLGRCNMG